MFFKLLLPAMIITSLIGCAGGPMKPISAEEAAASKGYQLKQPVERIRNYQVDGWQYVNRRAVILETSPRKKYLVTLRDNCNELSSVEVIGTTSTNSSILSKFDAIITKQHGSNRRCFIDDIYLIEKE